MPAPAWRGLLVPVLFALVGVAILISLGNWQLHRLAWKEDLIARVETRTHSTPVPAPGPADWAALSEDWIDYRPLTVTGTFLHDDEIHVFTSLAEPRGPYGGVGYWILTPLKTADGWYVIVNRGFVPEDRKAVATRAASNRPGETTITGLAQQPWRGNAFTPDDEPARNVWFRRDPAAIAAALRLPADRVAPYMIDSFADPTLPDGLPEGGETRVSFPNNHLQYALTWFGLAAGLVVVFGISAWGRLKRSA